MLSLPPLFSPNVVAASLLNALLRREPWAAERLSRHAGKALRFTVGGVRVGFSIEASGTLRACDPAIVPDVTLTLNADHLADLPAILRNRDPSAITEKLHVQGDAGLAALVSELARDLRWDVEEDMAALFGDVLGLRLLQGARGAFGVVRSAAERATANVVEYLGEEGRVLATRPAFDGLRQDYLSVSQRLDALERRVAAYDARRGG